MDEASDSCVRVALEHGFSGVVRLDRPGHEVFERAFGLADRAFGVDNRVDTLFATASATKAFTALTIVSLIADGLLTLDTPARSVLGETLPEIDDRVSIEQLLSHRSGIGDYCDEDAGFGPTDYVMEVPVHTLVDTEDYLPALGGRPTKFAPGERFDYCNGAFVVLALIAERVGGAPYADLVATRVCAPAGLRDTSFLRSDELPGRAARGYLERDGLRTNVLHLPVRGNGDGGIYSTVADVRALWEAFAGGRIVSPSWVEEMVRPRSEGVHGGRAYGLGFWLDPAAGSVDLEGADVGVSFHSAHHRASGVTWTVVSNTTDRAWPLVAHLGALRF